MSIVMLIMIHDLKKNDFFRVQYVAMFMRNVVDEKPRCEIGHSKQQ